jgi:hypothetical protein
VSFTDYAPGYSLLASVTVFEEEGDCIVCLEMRADELMRRLISGELTNYSVVRTSPEPLHTLSATALSKWLTINGDVKTTEIKENPLVLY